MTFGRPFNQGPRHGPRKLDPVKAMIAQAVQHHLVTGPQQPPIPSKPENVDDVEGHAISPTETMIRVKTSNQGIRYFTIKVSESMLWVTPGAMATSPSSIKS